MHKIIIILLAIVGSLFGSESSCLDVYWGSEYNENILLDSVYFYEENSGIGNDWGWKYTYKGKQVQYLISDSYNGNGPDTTVVYNSAQEIPLIGSVLYQEMYKEGDTLIYEYRIYVDGVLQSKARNKLYNSIKILSHESSRYSYIDTMILRNDSIIVIDHGSFEDSTVYEYIIQSNDLTCYVYDTNNEIKDSILLLANVPKYLYVIEEGQNPRRSSYFREISATSNKITKVRKIKNIYIDVNRKYDLIGRSIRN